MSLISRPIQTLGGRVVSSGDVFSRTGPLYDYAIGGIGLLAADSNPFPFERATAPFRKEQFDNSDNPGEQSLSNWWLRSQSSFHFGAGIQFMEPANNDEVMSAFNTSVGVDPWTPGQLRLLKRITLKKSAAGTVLVLGAIDGSTDVYLQAEAATLSRETSSASSAVTWGGTGTILSLAEDGTNYYAADSTGIYRGTLAGGAGSLLWNTGSSNVVIAWAKQRLVAGIANRVYELTGTGPTLPTPLYTHPNANWQWTSITEGPSAIYMAGYAGAQSAIYKFTLSSTGVMPTLTQGIIAATLPTGEVIHSIYAYVGSYIAIGTNKGVRIGEIADNGDIAYGPLIVESTAPVYGFVGKDRFLFATCTNQIDGSSGLWRIDLGRTKEDGRFPYATDLQARGITGIVRSVTLLGASGRLVVAISGSGSYIEHATDLVVDGYLTTGYVRFNTIEPKRFLYVTARSSGGGSVGISAIDAGGSEAPVVTLTSASSEDYGLNRIQKEERLALKITLSRDSTDWTVGPTLHSWQIKALPAITRQRFIRVPVLLYEQMRDSKGTLLPPLDVYSQLNRLEALETEASPVLFQQMCHGRAELVVIESVEFQQMTPPANCKGEGGIAYLTLRTVQ